MNGAPLSDSLADLEAKMRAVSDTGGGGIGRHLWSSRCSWRCWPGGACASRARYAPSSRPTASPCRRTAFSYGARWADASLVTENGAAYLMRFNRLYMRLPKRGLAPE